jgi:hypothetical protein
VFYEVGRFDLAVFSGNRGRGLGVDWSMQGDSQLHMLCLSIR